MDRTHYTQLTLEERYHIQVMRKQGKSLRSIAIGMGRSHSTLSRELRRNQGGRGYRHKQADRLAFQRHRNKAKAKKLTQETQDYIQEKIRPDTLCIVFIGRGKHPCIGGGQPLSSCDPSCCSTGFLLGNLFFKEECVVDRIECFPQTILMK